MAITELVKKAVSNDVLKLLHRIMLDPVFDDFYLVGGTALALQIGHRNRLTSTFSQVKASMPIKSVKIYAGFTREKRLSWSETPFALLLIISK